MTEVTIHRKSLDWKAGTLNIDDGPELPWRSPEGKSQMAVAAIHGTLRRYGINPSQVVWHHDVITDPQETQEELSASTI